LILTDIDIRRVLPAIQSCDAAFFSLHEVHVTKALLESDNPWKTLGKTLASFPLYPRYQALIRNQVEDLKMSS
jgi:hypothetical protein